MAARRRDPAADLTARVLASTVARATPSRALLAWSWIVAGLAALGALVIAGYELGASLAASDGLELLAAVLQDVGLLTTAPGDVLAALGEVIPWSLVALAGSSAVLLIPATGNVVSRASASLHPRPLVQEPGVSAWLKRSGLHVAAAGGATGVFVVAAAAAATGTLSPRQAQPGPGARFLAHAITARRK